MDTGVMLGAISRASKELGDITYREEEFLVEEVRNEAMACISDGMRVDEVQVRIARKVEEATVGMRMMNIERSKFVTACVSAVLACRSTNSQNVA